MRFEKKYLAIDYECFFICRYWCSTKVDNELEHVGGQGNWGFCRQSCPPIIPVISISDDVISRPAPENKKPLPNGVSSNSLKRLSKI